MTDSTALVRLAAAVAKNPGRKTGYTATWGLISAAGANRTEATNNLTIAIDTALRTITEAQPAFATDDQGGLWVAVPAFDGGHNQWRVTAEDARQCGSSVRPTAEAFTRSAGMTIVPPR